MDEENGKSFSVFFVQTRGPADQYSALYFATYQYFLGIALFILAIDPSWPSCGGGKSSDADTATKETEDGHFEEHNREAEACHVPPASGFRAMIGAAHLPISAGGGDGGEQESRRRRGQQGQQIAAGRGDRRQ